MIIYQSTKSGFAHDVLSGDIEQVILRAFQEKMQYTTSMAEIRSWKNSMQYMDRVLADADIPSDVGISIEYKIPQTSRRIDFIVTGQDERHMDHAILIELKQWSEARPTSKDGIVMTYVGGREREESHPSYQAWSYAALLEGFNATVYEEQIQLKPCAYLHNYTPDDVITNDFYAPYIERAPVFLKSDAERLRGFIKQFVRHGDTSNIMYRIDHGKIKPSKQLADHLSSLLKGNQDFVLIDDQKIVYETALSLARTASAKRKHVLVVEGGPGTGKSVIAINLLTAITNLGLNTRYVTKNAAPRAVYEKKLTGKYSKDEISNFFSGSGSFTSCEPNVFDALIVDEAHRLNEKSGLYQNKGENQIKELIEAATCTIFFIDEDQRVTWGDIGEKEVIKRWAQTLGAEIHEMALTSQFRCNGSDGYLAWLDHMLQIRETANTVLDTADYDFRVVDSPTELRELIYEKNAVNNKARLVAGYCWDWVSKKNAHLSDIRIPEHDFAARWNLMDDGNLWIINPQSVSEVGCIHTCQGLEVDYIGVIIGPDLVVRDGRVITDARQRADTDASIKGWKKSFATDPERTQARLDMIIKNTYRTLMTRGMKGCYVYCVDKETEKYLKSKLSNLA